MVITLLSTYIRVMKNIAFLFVVLLGIFQSSFAQKQTEGSFELNLLGTEFVDKTSYGVGLGVNKNWHEYFQIGFGVQVAINQQRNTYGYEIGTPYFSASAFTINNTARIFTLGNFSLEANANLGWLNINLQDDDVQEFNPVFGFWEAETIVSENFRFLQGGLTLNYIVSRRSDTNVAIFTRVLQNQAFGNVRFGGQEENSELQFSLGVKIIAF